jgi:hypothetical protein
MTSKPLNLKIVGLDKINKERLFKMNSFRGKIFYGIRCDRKKCKIIIK